MVLEFNFIILMCRCVCMYTWVQLCVCVDVHTGAGALRGQGTESPGDEVISHFKAPHVGARN